MDYFQQLGKMIKEAREKEGLELKQFAEILNVSRIYIHDIELGNRFPSVEELKKISSILDISVDVNTHKKELARNPPIISNGRKYLIEFTPEVTEVEREEVYRRIDEINNWMARIVEYNSTILAFHILQTIHKI